MIRPPIRLTGKTQRQFAASYILEAAPDGCVIEFKSGEKRSQAQNDLMWGRLEDISRQVIWYGKTLTAEDWKDVLTASLRKARVVPTIDGDGFVPLGMRTSQMNKAEFGALLDLIDAFGAQQGVTFSDEQKKLASLEEARR